MDLDRKIFLTVPHSPTDDFPAAEEWLRSVVDHVIDGIITIDEHGIVTTFNPAAERIFGYRADEVIGDNIKMLMPEPFRRQHDGYIDNYLRTGEAKIIGIGREVVGQRKDGSSFPMELAISEFHIRDRRYFTGIVRDITARKHSEETLRQAEERMRSVVDHVVDGIITIDGRGHIESFNRAAQQIFGYAQEEVLGRNVKMLMPEPYCSAHDQYIRNYLSTGQAKIIGIGREVVGRRKDGSNFPMELAVSEFHLGAQRYFTGIVRDITERKRLERELHERLQELAQADRQKNEFLAMLSHELRNPLAPIRNAVHLLKLPGVQEQVANQAREVVERQLHQLVRLVDDLLDISRIIQGRIELRKQAVDLTMAVRRAVETAQPVIDAHGHTLETVLTEQPVYVRGDLVRLAQAVSNLLTNAAKHSGRCGRIVLKLQTQADAALITVSDQGSGIEPELLPKVFDLFVQGDHSFARSQGGLGIGLTLVKRLVQMHGGEVTANSPGPGRGSDFLIRLPVVGSEVEPPVIQIQPPTVVPARAETRSRILVVDDNEDAAESTAALLDMYGLDAHCVFDAPTALQAADKYRPRFALVDIGLPGMDGYELAARLRAKFGSDIVLIAVTGYGREEDRENSRQAGFDHHLTKPVDPKDLISFIQQTSGNADNSRV